MFHVKAVKEATHETKDLLVLREVRRGSMKVRGCNQRKKTADAGQQWQAKADFTLPFDWHQITRCSLSLSLSLSLSFSHTQSFLARDIEYNKERRFELRVRHSAYPCTVWQEDL